MGRGGRETVVIVVGREDEPLVLREGWDAVYQYSGRGGRQTVVTGEGLEEKLLVRREGWEVVVLVNATRSPLLRACNFPVFLSRRFHRQVYFYF